MKLGGWGSSPHCMRMKWSDHPGVKVEGPLKEWLLEVLKVPLPRALEWLAALSCVQEWLAAGSCVQEWLAAGSCVQEWIRVVAADHELLEWNYPDGLVEQQLKHPSEKLPGHAHGPYPYPFF